MPHPTEAPDLADRVRADGVSALVEAAEEIWTGRRNNPDAPVAGPRPFEDAFPTFYQFSNSPQR
ncbi:MAG: hypothetical protein HOU81_18980 [Hamadaea sp.]|uniref:multiple cyclophane-containing RiPP AmcA n=1 Tax=Hamadaea sp. TaxID=2024425 RepID=UPI00184E7BF3|nr:multiple cyclophane-containing RiPP AmcA [Hamadaea sp.]NUR72054.1 hypothetical protein [Hamadaea sp.]NUR72904.1 hypothetical protein [Hamadaea sp.]NUT17604.1 hypothetical protein [Hamadaea sp.]